MMGVDPTKLPDPAKWLERYRYVYSQPIENRKTFVVIWESGGVPVGFSTTDKIVYGHFFEQSQNYSLHRIG